MLKQARFIWNQLKIIIFEPVTIFTPVTKMWMFNNLDQFGALDDYPSVAVTGTSSLFPLYAFNFFSMCLKMANDQRLLTLILIGALLLQTCSTNMASNESLSDYMWRNTEAERIRVMNSTFVKAIRAGMLDPTEFGNYLLESRNWVLIRNADCFPWTSYQESLMSFNLYPT